MCQWTGSSLVQVMVVTCSVPSHYMNQCWIIVNWTCRNNLQWNSNGNTKLFIDENAFESVVCEMAACMSRGRWVKKTLRLLPTILPQRLLVASKLSGKWRSKIFKFDWHIAADTKWPPFSRQHFHINILVWKLFHNDWNFTVVCA